MDYDEANMKVTLSDPFFKIGGDGMTYIHHSPVHSRGSMFNFETFKNLKTTQRAKVHQTMKNLDIWLVNGGLVDTFKKELFPKPEKTIKMKKAKTPSTKGIMNTDYSFPKVRWVSNI